MLRFFVPQNKMLEVFPQFLLIEKWKVAAQVEQRKMKEITNLEGSRSLICLFTEQINLNSFVEPQCTN
jgi:hypothetical protein